MTAETLMDEDDWEQNEKKKTKVFGLLKRQDVEQATAQEETIKARKKSERLESDSRRKEQVNSDEQVALKDMNFCDFHNESLNSVKRFLLLKTFQMPQDSNVMSMLLYLSSTGTWVATKT